MVKVNSLVELVDDNWPEWVYTQIEAGHVKELPAKGPIYTIREIVQKDNGQALLLEEIINPAPKGMGEIVFSINRFRELQPPQEISSLVENIECV